MKRGVVAARPRGRFGLRRRLSALSAIDREGTIDPRTLRFRDRDLETAFREDYFEHNLANLRLAHLYGIFMWVVWGLFMQAVLPFFDRPLDMQVRYGVFIPLLLIGLGLSFTRWYPRIWEWEIGGAVLLSMLVWVYYVSQVRTMPPDYGYVGLILISVIAYSIVRLRFLVVLLLTSVAIASYLPVAILSQQIAGLKTMLAIFYLISFGFLGCVAAYRLERFTRLLFLRERQLDQERARSEDLLRNILPQPIVDRLKERAGTSEDRRLAEALDDVTVLFADAVGFTEQAGRTRPEDLVETLDLLFSRFDVLADRFGLEKIKTVGDAYMAAAGAPVPRADHVRCTAEMALAIVSEVEIRWPSGEPIEVRIGIAAGPVVAGVIGTRKFAYDLWGDTVNLASRLESAGEPGRIQVSEEVARRLEEEFVFDPPHVVELKGKGPTTARFLLGRRSDSGAAELGADPSRDAQTA